MDTETGRMYRFADDDEREKLEAQLSELQGRQVKLEPLSEGEACALSKLEPEERVAWWRKHRLARGPEETDEDYRKIRNFYKRQRRARARG